MNNSPHTDETPQPPAGRRIKGRRRVEAVAFTVFVLFVALALVGAALWATGVTGVWMFAGSLVVAVVALLVGFGGAFNEGLRKGLESGKNEEPTA